MLDTDGGWWVGFSRGHDLTGPTCAWTEISHWSALTRVVIDGRNSPIPWPWSVGVKGIYRVYSQEVGVGVGSVRRNVQ